MKKVITICGITNLKTNECNSLQEEYKRAKYSYSENLKALMKPLKKQTYINMLPLLIDNCDDAKIVPIFTKEAKESQSKVLNNEFKKDYKELFSDDNLIKGEQDFLDILRIINENLSDDHEYYIDLTHGFRHIPILATIALISQNISNSKKIKAILFAKEIKYAEEYEIIDLKEYLEIANMTFMLENFSQNYTIATSLSFTNKDFESLRELLFDLSNNILSNSLKHIFDGTYLDITLEKLNAVLKYEHKLAFKSSIERIKENINEIKSLKDKSDSEKLYGIAKMLLKKGYLLNAITLLYESIGTHCIEIIKNTSYEVNVYIKNKYQNIKQTDNYNLTKNYINIIKATN